MKQQEQKDRLLDPISVLPGLSRTNLPLLRQLLADAGGEREPRICDLLFHLPNGRINRHFRSSISEANNGENVVLCVTVKSHRPPTRFSRAPYRIICFDSSGTLDLIYFNAPRHLLARLAPVGATIVVSGKIQWYRNRAQISHPDQILPEEQRDSIPEAEPVYRLTSGLTNRALRYLMRQALTHMRHSGYDEWCDNELLSEEGWPGFQNALTRLHEPHLAQSELINADDAYARLAYDELLSYQLALALIRRSMKQGTGEQRSFSGNFRDKIIAALPYQLTADQKRALGEVEEDLRSPNLMLRLLQGDVGSGKTVIALLAMVDTIESGAQAALMAPSDLLARQHFETIAPIYAQQGLQAALLTGKDAAGHKKQVRMGLASGRIHAVIGTHALFQDQVQFRKLGLIVIDEQHRFGVQQRLTLAMKGSGTDTLVMSATPIPRTMVLAHFGDIAVSRLQEKPAGRQKIKTVIVNAERTDQVIERLQKAVLEGNQAFWVCPLVEDSQTLNVADVEARFAELKKIFPGQVGQAHGRRKKNENNAAMDAFRSADTKILVATTVIEVGVDVPNATIIVIEDADRFGLSQLHQLRGRVGRGQSAATCVLLYRAPLTQYARRRLEILRENDDGFIISEEDLRLRGEGDVLGVRQSGGGDFRMPVAELRNRLIQIACKDAALTLQQDPYLVSPRGRALQRLLYLFGRDNAVKLLRAG